MTIFAVDDEPRALHTLCRVIGEAESGADVQGFGEPAAVLEAVERGARPDVLFCDVEMPGMSGVELGKRLKQSCPQLNVVFATGYDDYMSDAFALHASGYLKKPITAEDIRAELDNLRFPASPQTRRVRIQTFGNFEVFIDGKPVRFARDKAKEYLAYLVDRGTLCTSAAIAAALWEHSVSTAYVRRLRKDVLDVFESAGCGDVLIRDWNKQGIRAGMVDCDYYDWKRGLPRGLNAYHGEYMNQYSWAELTHGALGEEEN